MFDELKVGELFGWVEFDVNDLDIVDVLWLDFLCLGFDLDFNMGEIILRLKFLLLCFLINSIFILWIFYIENIN